MKSSFSPPGTTTDHPADQSPPSSSSSFSSYKTNDQSSLKRDETWFKRFHELRQFKARFGHCKVPVKYPENPKFGGWLSAQRRHYKYKKEGKPSQMTDERMKLLDEIGICVNMKSLEESWREMYDQLKEFKFHHGHCKVPQNSLDNPKLGNWVRTQRRQYKYLREGKPTNMTEGRIRALEEIGFVWYVDNESPSGTTTPEDERWYEHFEHLKQFKDRNGHCDVPRNFLEFPKLGTWVNNQRMQLKYWMEGDPSQMSQDRLQALEEIGFFDVGSNDENWHEMYEKLKMSQDRYGHCKVSTENLKLSQWVQQQRAQYSYREEGKPSVLTDERILALEETGFSWTEDDKNKFCLTKEKCEWKKHYKELIQFKSLHGHTNVPILYLENQRLSTWVHQQRMHYKCFREGKSSSLTEERLKSLEQIGFSWNVNYSPKVLKWMERYEELKKFKTRHGHCKVRRNFSENPKLGIWVNNQKMQYKNWKEGKLSQMTIERMQALEKIGLTTTTYKAKTDTTTNSSSLTWKKHYDELKQFKEQFGHCNVPQYFLENPNLDKWVRNQRKRYKSGKLSEDEIRALEDVGFSWNVDPSKSSTWKEQYEELKLFKTQFGHCKVPRNYPQNPKLGTWVYHQTLQYNNFKQGKASSMNEEMMRELDEIGFGGDIFKNDESWYDHFEELHELKLSHGHCNILMPFPENCELVQWASTQRIQYENWEKGELSTLTEEKIQSLEDIGFSWQYDNSSQTPTNEESEWNEYYQHLNHFHAHHGHCKIPVRYPEHPKLSTWMNQQKIHYQFFNEGKPSLLTIEKIQSLEEIGGFSWKIDLPLNDEKWLKRFEELRFYKIKYGDCKVPRKFPENPKLGTWVNNQRMQYRKFQIGKSSQMTMEKIQAMEELGFLWNVKNGSSWNDNYEELLLFKEIYGHCKVPQKFAENPQLGRWVSNQRMQYKNLREGKSSKMTEERIQALETIGFLWRVVDNTDAFKHDNVGNHQEGNESEEEYWSLLMNDI